MVSESAIRAQLDEWVQSEIDSHAEDGFSAPELITEALAHFSTVPGFMERCAEAYIRSVLSQIVSNALAQRRYMARIGSEVVTKTSIEKRLKKAERWRRWFEYVPGEGMVPLMEMNRPQLLTAIEKRNKDVRTQQATVATFRTLIAGLDNDKIKVGKRFSPGQIAAIYRKNQVDMGGNGEEFAQAI